MSALFLTFSHGCSSGTTSAVRVDGPSDGVRLVTDRQAIDAADGMPASVVVAEVVDPDRFVAEDGTVIQLIGIVAPIADSEKRIGDDYYGRAALEFVRGVVQGKRIDLKYEGDARDPLTGGLNAHVYLDNGAHLNYELARRGFAIANCKRTDVRGCEALMRAQFHAVRRRDGIWNPDTANVQDVGADDIRKVESTVRTVLDGDTVQLVDGTVVRYIAIDAPENAFSYLEGELGNTSLVANRRLVEGKRVILEYDVEPVDPRGRDLAYVWVEHQGQMRMVNELLVEQGYAWVAIFPPNVRHVPRLMEAQDRSMTNGAGLWARQQPK